MWTSKRSLKHAPDAVKKAVDQWVDEGWLSVSLDAEGEEVYRTTKRGDTVFKVVKRLAEAKRQAEAEGVDFTADYANGVLYDLGVLYDPASEQRTGRFLMSGKDSN